MDTEFNSVMSNSLQPHGLQDTRPPYPSPTPRVYSNSCPLSQWCHLTISSCCPLLLPSILPSIRVFSSESVLRIRWPKYWRFSFSISPSNEYSGLISFRMDWLDLLAVQRDSQKSSPTPQFKSISSSMLSFLYSPNFTSVHGCQMQDNLSIFIWRSHISFTTAKWHRNHCPCQALYIDNYARIFSLVIPCMLSK